MGFRADLQRGWEAVANNFRAFFLNLDLWFPQHLDSFRF